MINRIEIKSAGQTKIVEVDSARPIRTESGAIKAAKKWCQQNGWICGAGATARVIK